MSLKKGRPARTPDSVRYKEWMATLLPCRHLTGEAGEEEIVDETSRHVRAAIEKLSDDEAFVVERVYLMGAAPEGVARETGCSVSRVERLLKSARAKLRSYLAGYVRSRFGINDRSRKPCRICDSPDRMRAERIVCTKRPEETWRRIMRELDEIGIHIRAPQTLIGHVKYHKSELVEEELTTSPKGEDS